MQVQSLCAYKVEYAPNSNENVDAIMPFSLHYSVTDQQHDFYLLKMQELIDLSYTVLYT